MANQGPSYGMSREVKLKMAAKYDPNLEPHLRDWIADTSKCQIKEDLTFQNWLKDGRVLCYLVKALKVDVLDKKMPHEKMLNPFRCMENISAFLNAITKLGVPVTSLCTTADLFDGSGMSQVQTCLLALIDAAHTQNLTTETAIGIRISEKQNRNWSEEQLRAGDTIIGLQAGTNKCASQSGMTAYGSARSAFDKKYTTEKQA